MLFEKGDWYGVPAPFIPDEAFTLFPPGLGPASRSKTLAPRDSSVLAVVRPARPAPMMMVDDDYHENLTPNRVRQILKGLK